jgi:glycerol-3-phosphate O-acyltransferase
VSGVAASPTGAPAARARPPWWFRLLRRLLEPWVHLSIEFDPAAKPSGAVCYVLERYGLSNVLLLDLACSQAGWPSPWSSLLGVPFRQKRAFLALSRRTSSPFKAFQQMTGAAPAPKSHSESLAILFGAHRLDPGMDVRVVPVSLFVGRAPERADGWFSVLFSENWAFVGNFRRFLAILLNGRETLVRFAPSISVRNAADESLPAEIAVRKLARVLRVHFTRVRRAVIGPDLSTRRLLISKLLAAEPVRQAVADAARRDKISERAAWAKAGSMAYEIAADYSPAVVRSASFLLRWVWSRIFRGVTVHHLERLKQSAEGHEVIYVPSHRSHMDDLLLPYLLYTHGIVPPHIVAGINLNLPLVGRLLRKGGAFFIRRSISGNALYSAVLAQYISELVAGGYSIAYFIEGGRSRTGRLLPPKHGALAMTVRGYLQRPTRPVLFQPVYIGYEKLMEGRSYLDELSGKPKEAESIWQLVTGIPKVLRNDYGKVFVNFGAPIRLDDLLASHAPEWDGQALATSDKPKWLTPVIDDLANQIQVRINQAADVNPVNLLALSLLSTPRHAMSESDLLAQLALLKLLLVAVPYADTVTVTPMEPSAIVAYGEQLGIVTRVPHPLGDMLQVVGDSGVLLTYFRNSVVHLMTPAAWLACCFHHNTRMPRATVVRNGRMLYPFMQEELFLPWTGDGFEEQLDRTIDVFLREGLLTEEPEGVLVRKSSQSDEQYRLRVLGHPLQQAFERYYIALTILSKGGSGVMTSGELERACHLAAQRLSLLYTPAAPEFFDKTLFRVFIRKAKELRLFWTDGNSKLAFDESIERWTRDARAVLAREMRQTIEKITPGVALPPAA